MSDVDVETTDRPAARAERCLGDLCGLVTALRFRQGDRDAGDFVATELTTAALEGVVDGDGEGSVDVTVGGGGRTRTDATLTSLGEFLERYSMYWPVEDTVEATCEALRSAGERVVYPDYLRVWDDADLAAAGLDPFDPETTVEWAGATDLLSGETVFLPAELVAFRPNDDDGAGHVPSSTSGAACGSSLAGALARSLYEVIERDAVMRTWYEQRVPQRLDVSAWPDLERFREQIAPAHYRLELLELDGPTDCAVVAAALVNERDREPKFRLFAGADLTLAGAVRDALHEAAEGFLQTKYRLAAGGSRDDDIDVSNVYNFEDNVRYYARPANFDAVAHLLDGEVRSVADRDDATPGDAVAELDRALDALTATTEMTPLAVDLTPADVRDLGMYATSVYVPELIDIALPGAPPVDHPALDDLATRSAHPFP
ncbi:YcaO-like family protein [Halomicrobium salinisoli]|uniref:YcaO-like family protein n=1 Tax=Halomicrobium salinisoli TaxID=2878391 RepID=UPI001CEFB7F7|nr:YcaO-like family protein [Halomicrobium salinisoli]